jgi:hypothetical protein
MKSFTAFVLPAILTTCTFAEPADPPASAELNRAFVTIPYSELRALWEAGQRKAEVAKIEAPPVAYVVHRADCELQLGDPACTLTAVFEVESLETRWQTVPLLGGAVRLEKADAGSRLVVAQGNDYALLTNQPDKTPVTLQLATRGAKSLTAQSPLLLKTGNATVKRLTISGIPAGMEARVDGQLASETKDGAAIFSLPSTAAEVSIQIQAARAEAPQTPSHWQVRSQVLVRYGESRLRYLSQVFAHADDGSGMEMTLDIPGNASTVVVKGQDIADWTQTRAEDGRRTVSIKWKTRDVLDRELIVEYATPQSPMAEQWTLQAPAAAAQQEMRNIYVILPSDGLELKGDGVRTGIDSRRLPEWMRNEIGGGAFVTVEAGTQLALQTNWLPAMATAEAIVTESKCGLRLVADGSLQSTTTYAIRHSAPLVWRLELPANVQLLSCTVAGRPARPVQREPGVIELSLSAPDESAKGVTTVALVYTARSKALDPVAGEIALELPRTELFIERLEWSIEIPDPFEITAFDGNLSVAAKSEDKTDARQLALRKDFCRAERPAVALFYQRHTLQK